MSNNTEDNNVMGCIFVVLILIFLTIGSFRYVTISQNGYQSCLDIKKYTETSCADIEFKKIEAEFKTVQKQYDSQGYIN